MSNIIQAVTDALDIRNVGPQILQKVPTLVRRALLDLQRDDVIPPKGWEFLSADQKREKRDLAGNLLYYFYRMPQDFRKLDSFYVSDNGEPYEYNANYSYFNTRTDENRRKLFSVTETNDEYGKPYTILVADPFPSEEYAVKIVYHVDGTETGLDYLDQEYWNVIIDRVESMLGLRNPQDSENSSIDMASSWRRRKGINTINKTMERVKGKFFGSNPNSKYR